MASRPTVRLTLFGAISALALSSCATTSGDDSGQSPSPSTSSSASAEAGHGGHKTDGGPAPEGIQQASDPEYAVGSEVTLDADHMEGMDGSDATISGAFDTTTYSVSYTPTDGGDPVTDHKWVVQEELQNPGQEPMENGSEAVLSAEHMPGMDGAEATIENSTSETVYMVDYAGDGMEMTNHKWVVESEISPAA